MTERVRTSVNDGVGIVLLDRPDKLNAFAEDMWTSFPEAVNRLGNDPSVRVVVVRGEGPAFTVGIDLEMLGGIAPRGRSDVESRMRLMARIKELQGTFSSLAQCPKPVIAAIHGYCLGAGIDLITACDIRWASADAVFSVRETRMGLVADVGTMQRLPHIINPGRLAELVYTGKDIDAEAALDMGLITKVFPDRDQLEKGVMELANEIAANSPLVVEGAKRILAAGEGRTVAEALDYMALWNAAFLISDDLGEAMAAFIEKRPPRFEGK